ncbi:membrane protein [Klebsiella michiganensis]|nr:membrane protein [Klebsiella michiganensis]
MEKYPWLPVEEDGRLHDPVLRENFVERVFALHELNCLHKNGLTRRALLDFHSRYKLQLLAHHQADTARLARSLPRSTNGRIWRLSLRSTAKN